MAANAPLPVKSGILWVRAFKRDGWYVARQQGDDVILAHPAKPGRVKMRHDSRDVPAGSLLAAIRASGMSRDEVRGLL